MTEDRGRRADGREKENIEQGILNDEVRGEDGGEKENIEFAIGEPSASNKEY